MIYIRQDQIAPLVTKPPRSQSINELTDEVAYSLTWFTKEQYCQMLLHWRLPEEIVTKHRHHFSGEELLIVCVAKIETRDPWIRLIPGYFCGDVRR